MHCGATPGYSSVWAGRYTLVSMRILPTQDRVLGIPVCQGVPKTLGRGEGSDLDGFYCYRLPAMLASMSIYSQQSSPVSYDAFGPFAEPHSLMTLIALK